MRRLAIVAFAVVGALLITTAPVAGQSAGLVVGSIHQDDQDFNNADTLTNLTVSGSGASASVNLSQNPVHAGNYALKGGNSGADYQIVKGLSGSTVENISFWVRKPSLTGSTARPSVDYRDSSGNFLTSVAIDDGSNTGDAGSVVYWNSGFTDTGIDITAGEYYEIKVDNIDYSAETFDIEVYDSTGSLVGSVTGLAFRDSVSEMSDMRITDRDSTFYIDNIHYDNKLIEGFESGDLSGWTGDTADYDVVVSTPDSAEYISANHSVSQAQKAFANLTLTNANADVRWEYYDGTSWVLKNSSTYTTTGNYTLDISGVDQSKWRANVSFTNKTGSTTAKLHDEGILFTPHEPTISNIEPADGTNLNKSDVDLSADVNDTDFPTAQGDSVSVELIVDGTTEHTNTITSNGTVSTTVSGLSGGSHTYKVKATDDYGNTVTSAERTINAPSTLSIRNETSPDQLIDTATVEVTFFASDEVVTKSTTNGKINLTGLPVDEKLIVRAESEDFRTRNIILKSLYDQENVYLLHKNKSAVEVRFELEDRTGTFPESESELYIERVINLSGDTQYRTIAADEFGTNGYTTYLQEGQRYQLRVEHQDNVRVLGGYTSSVSETVTLRPVAVGVSLNQTNVSTYNWSASYVEDPTTEVEFRYIDPINETTNLHVKIYPRGNESAAIYDDTTAGPVGSVSIEKILTGDQVNKTWVVEWTADREGEEISGKRMVGKQVNEIVGELPQWMQEAFAALIIVITGGLFSQLNVGVGAVTTSLTAGGFWMMGLLPPIAGGAITIALIIGVLVKNGVVSR